MWAFIGRFLASEIAKAELQKIEQDALDELKLKILPDLEAMVKAEVKKALDDAQAKITPAPAPSTAAKVVSAIAIAFLLAFPSKLKAADVAAPVPTVGDALASFKSEGNATVLNNGFVAYVRDINNGSDGEMVGSSFYQWAFLTADAGMVLPTDRNKTGTPLIGASLHFDRLLDICVPKFLAAVKAQFPQSSQRFLPLMYAGAAPVYNFNAASNQKALDLDIWSGLEWSW